MTSDRAAAMPNLRDSDASITSLSQWRNTDATSSQFGAVSQNEEVGETGLLPLPDICDPSFYLNRELSWLQFNRRVLAQAADHRLPLLERLKFLAITSSNLDEFYMKRIGGLKQQIGAGVTTLSIDGRTPRQQFNECATEVRDLVAEKERLYRELLAELRSNGIVILRSDELTYEDRNSLREHYRETIHPLLTPLAIDASHPFPFISNLSLNLLVILHHPARDVDLLARVKIPIGEGLSRFVDLGPDRGFVPVEDVVIENLDRLFPKLEVQSYTLFRVTRNASASGERTGADDLLEMIETELRNRKFAPVVRLQTTSGVDASHRNILTANLGLDEADDVFETDGMIGLSDLMELAGLDLTLLKDNQHHPVDNPSLRTDMPIFQSIRSAGTILLQHPYESFVTSIERFVCEASCDPQVVAIKATLYRTSAGTKIIEYLIDAAKNGKQVAVVVELQARFDEAANIRWASQLEEAGIHVNYGVLGLKTHCKAILIVRREEGGLRRYAHVGTGNYHAGTARLYSDVGLLTCEEKLTEDLSELFNHLTTGWTAARDYRQLIAAPLGIKKALLEKIQRETEFHSAASPGRIRLKTNALEDPDIVAALYKASQAGVKIDLLIRDICRLRPGIPGISENISVRSIIGRFLEHTRIYHFRNGGNDEYYIGSADLMTRNLQWRVEIIVPVPSTQTGLLDEFLKMQIQDRRQAWEMHADGNYERCALSDPNALGCQDAAILAAARRIAMPHLRQSPSAHVNSSIINDGDHNG